MVERQFKLELWLLQLPCVYVRTHVSCMCLRSDY
jgi:hypothetical protein